jgi:tetraacyldisaccharide-1-P 4'-kinase
MELHKGCGATAFVTTEKDAINLGSHLNALQPLYIVPVAMRLEDPSAVLDALLTTIRERNPQRA